MSIAGMKIRDTRLPVFRIEDVVWKSYRERD